MVTLKYKHSILIANQLQFNFLMYITLPKLNLFELKTKPPYLLASIIQGIQHTWHISRKSPLWRICVAVEANTNTKKKHNKHHENNRNKTQKTEANNALQYFQGPQTAAKLNHKHTHTHRERVIESERGGNRWTVERRKILRSVWLSASELSK